VKSRFLQYNVTPPFYFDRDCVTLASQYIADEAVKLLDSQQQDNLLKLVMDHRQEARLRGGLGQVFEPLVHLRMKEHGLGPILITDLDEEKKQFTVGLPSKRMPVLVIRALADVAKLKPGEYGEPDKGKFACIDAAVKLDDGSVVLFQTTVGDEHPIKGKRLLDILDLLPEQKEYPLIFVTVEGNQTLSGSQKLLTADSKKQLDTLTGRLQDVKQYVYRMPLIPKPAKGEAPPVLGGLLITGEAIKESTGKAKRERTGKAKKKRR
jgi:hypothetical protein